MSAERQPILFELTLSRDVEFLSRLLAALQAEQVRFEVSREGIWVGVTILEK